MINVAVLAGFIAKDSLDPHLASFRRCRRKRRRVGLGAEQRVPLAARQLETLLQMRCVAMTVLKVNVISSLSGKTYFAKFKRVDATMEIATRQ